MLREFKCTCECVNASIRVIINIQFVWIILNKKYYFGCLYINNMMFYEI